MAPTSAPTSHAAIAAGPYRLPEQIERFTVHAQVGYGGTACTFVASEPGPDGTALLKCIKIPSPQLLFQYPAAQIREIFRNEAAVLRQLPPTNIAPLEGVIDLGDDQGVMGLVYTFIHGLNLSQLIERSFAQRELLPWEGVVGIAIDIAGALDEAHTDHRGRAFYAHPRIVHRDICPSNVMLDGRGNAFLIDFGFARVMRNVSKLQASRAHPGRIAYAAPEYFVGEGGGGGRYDPRLDLFSTGALLLEALTGRRAFKGVDVQKHIAQVRARDRARVEDLRPEFRAASVDPKLEAFVDIVGRLLEPSPDERLQSAGTLLTALLSLGVGMDRRPVGAMVTQHQDSLQNRVTRGRVDRREVVGRRRAAPTTLKGVPPFAAVPPEEVWVGQQAAHDLGQFAPRRSPKGSPPDFPNTHHDAPVIRTTAGGESTEPADWIPETNPSRDAIPIRTEKVNGAHEARSSTKPSRAEDALASSRAFAGARRMKTAAVVNAALFLSSLFLLGTHSTLWVPLITGQLGWTAIDSFWTPLLTELGVLGVGAASFGAIVLGLFWARGRRAARGKDAPD